MGNPNKKKGTSAETKVCRFLMERCTSPVEVRRKALAGHDDAGDIDLQVLPGYDDEGCASRWMLEVKAGKQTTAPSRKQLDEWLRQTVNERDNCNYICHAALVVVRYNRKLEDADVYFCRKASKHPVYMHLDEFAKYVS